MANEIKYGALKTLVTALTGTGSDLKNLANAALYLGSSIDNSDAANRNTYADFELKVRLQSGASGSPYVEVWLIESVDGTNFEDGSASVVPPRPADIIIPVSTSLTTQMRFAVQGVTLPPTPFKCLLRNSTGQSFTNTDNENVLSFRPYNVEVQ